MRNRAVLSAVCAAVVLVSGCSDSANPPEETIDTFTLVQSAAPDTFKPSFGTANHAYMYALYDTLVRTSTSGDPQPLLADSWEVDPSGTSVTFQLHPGAMFSDGSPVTAADIAYSMEWTRNPDNGNNLAPRFDAIIDSIEAVDDTTVVFHLLAPSPGLFDLLDQFAIVNQDKADVIDAGGAGSGPFVVETTTAGSSITLTRRDDYWRDTQGSVESYTINVISDADAQFAALSSGQADMIYRPVGQTVRLAEADAGLSVKRSNPGTVVPYLMLNVSRPPFDDVAVRQAIALATDRESMIEIGYPDGGAVADCQPFGVESWAHTDAPLETCEFNVERAQQILTAAGYAPGSVSFEVNVSHEYGPPNSPDMAQILQADLAKVGITMSINVLDGATARDRLVNGSDFDAVIHMYDGANADPSFILPSRTFGPVNGFSTFTSPEYETLIAQAQTSLDRDERVDLYGQIAQIISREAFIVPLGQAYNVELTRTGVDGLVFGLSGWPDISNLVIQA